MAAKNARRHAGHAFGILIAAYACAAVAACEPPELAGNAPADKHPRLTWPAIEGATSYRVRLQSRVPDGRVLAFYDTVVAAPEFLPPRPLTEHRAKVTVRLNAICGAETSADNVATFVIDTSALCKLDDVEVGKASLKWRPVAGARSYEVRAYRLLDGRLLASYETRGAAAQLPLKEAAVVSVRPTCAGGLGEAVYQVLAR